MGDLWLVAWAMAGVFAAMTFAAGGVVHAQRSGRHWHESVLASQSYATVTVTAYTLSYLWLGPWWALAATPGVLVLAFCTALLGLHVAEVRAKRAVMAREQGK
jgi:hypothetical protein